MVAESKTCKIASYLAAGGAIVWLGGFNIRALMSLYLVQFSTLEFKPYIHPYVERTVFALISQSSMIVGIGYIVVWISGIVYLAKTPLKLKTEGWLMMSAVLFFVFTPVEIYTMILDFRMWLLDHAGSNDLVAFRKLFIHRLGALSGVPLIALMCYYTAIGLLVFRPLRKKGETINA
ncbi:MAG TPA: hypothetical protein VKS81_07845 [Bacteroidota bacterium]|nr:hypothetical protein [Bacteroidota bacterium]